MKYIIAETDWSSLAKMRGALVPVKAPCATGAFAASAFNATATFSNAMASTSATTESAPTTNIRIGGSAPSSPGMPSPTDVPPANTDFYGPGRKAPAPFLGLICLSRRHNGIVDLYWVGLVLAIRQHPVQGGIVMCDFDAGGFKNPEMCKKRPVVVLTPKIAKRPGLCTVVALSGTPPDPGMPYHRQIRIRPPLPAPWNSEDIWVKGDMVNAVAYHRLDLIRLGKNRGGKRIYHFSAIEPDQFKIVRECVLRALGLSALTKHL